MRMDDASAAPEGDRPRTPGLGAAAVRVAAGTFVPVVVIGAPLAFFEMGVSLSHGAPVGLGPALVAAFALALGTAREATGGRPRHALVAGLLAGPLALAGFVASGRIVDMIDESWSPIDAMSRIADPTDTGRFVGRMLENPRIAVAAAVASSAFSTFFVALSLVVDAGDADRTRRARTTGFLGAALLAYLATVLGGAEMAPADMCGLVGAMLVFAAVIDAGDAAGEAIVRWSIARATSRERDTT